MFPDRYGYGSYAVLRDGLVGRGSALVTKIRKGSVFLGMPTHRPLEVATVISIIETVEYCARHDIHVEWHIPQGSAPVGHSRSALCQMFLESDCEILFFIDSDTTWTVSEFLHLRKLSEHMPIVIGAYTMKTDPPKYALARQALDGAKVNEWGCIEVLGIGLGFAAIQRHVIVHMAAKAEKVFFSEFNLVGPYLFPYGIHFSLGSEQGITRTEEMPFLEACHAEGFKTFICPDVDLGHIGSKTYRHRLADALQLDALADGLGKSAP